MTSRLIILVTACAIVSSALPVPGYAVSYTATDLGSVYGYDLDDLGRVAGWADTRAVVREPTGATSYVPLWGEDAYSAAFGISNTGYVVGMCGPEAFRWNGTGQAQRLDGPGLKDAPYAVNNQGIVVGCSRDSASNDRAVMWSQSGGVSPIPGLPDNSVPYDVNDAGQVVGYYPDYGTFLWSEATGLENLSFMARAINNSGWIVGLADFTDPITRVGRSKAVVRKPGDELEVLASLPAWDSYHAVDITEEGRILGEAWGPGGTGPRAVIWNLDGSITDLGPGRPTAVNGRGQVLGTMGFPDGSVHSVLWEPVPEPGGLIVLAGGLAGMVASLLRRRR